ncbi:hypothetical protein JDS77_21935 [Bacillus cereus group sp. N28]|uniref:hypothetical protein n=1 Tax=Bacillus TaxID=1386 RepID=UPI000279847D|nr:MULTISPECIES: hypothetical protein [Bacillus]EJR99336.1 hypothetical protein IKO_05297 [Bacillus cereus VDM034]EJS11399.1 hypothetical protein IKS_05507 [Bacillus cereus VDM062]MBG9687761.1 hypothetical protein [Bacillus mycoides]MBJ7960340.1 hypothetical protein [Bacillus cereus group sp. N28]PRD07356.1 hypothetical protein CQ058_25900 [Bacillus sp. MYb56]
MTIYYFSFEAIPCSDNPEKDDCEGAFINCWVDSIDVNLALTKANNYINAEGWKVISIEDQFIANQKQYEGDYELKESLECFEQAMRDGIAAIFYTWSYDD